MKNLKWMIPALVLVLLLAGASWLYNSLKDSVELSNLATEATASPTEQAEASPEDTGYITPTPRPVAPDFTVYDGEGQATALSSFIGKPVVVNFWASWCGPCKSEMPDFQTAFEQYGDRVQFMIVNMTDGQRETVETASAYVAQQGYTFPVYYDTELSAATTYSVSAIPATYFFASDGSLVARASGAISLATLEKGLSMIVE